MEHELFLDHDALAYFDFQYFEIWWFIYVPPGLTLHKFVFSPHSAGMCFVSTSVQTVVIYLERHETVFFYHTNMVYLLLGIQNL